jgi:hypothetical protein
MTEWTLDAVHAGVFDQTHPVPGQLRGPNAALEARP